MLGFSREDRIAAIFCGSKKTLASGVPMARLIFGAHPGLALILLPIMVYHSLQLVVGGSYTVPFWIWFVLPQLAGLGYSEMAQRYGIAGLDEARAYLADPLLRQRLAAVISVIDEQLSQPGQSLEHLMGNGLDAAKTVSSLTLFEAAGLESAGALLDRIGRRYGQTLERLSRAQGIEAR